MDENDLFEEIKKLNAKDEENIKKSKLADDNLIK